MKRKSKRRRRKNKILWVLMICMGISAITICATKFIGKRKDRTTLEEVLLKYIVLWIRMGTIKRNLSMYNRFRQVWCPGSAFKPIIAALGLE